MSDNVHILSLSAYTTPTIQESKKDNWVEFGEDNNYYSFLIDRYTNSTTNNAIINNISRLVYGKGLSALDASKKPNEYAQMMALFNKDCVRKMVLDRKMLGQFAIQVHYNDKHDKILKAYHMPINLLRAEKCNKDGEITGYYYSDDWTDIKKFAPVRYSAFGTSKDKVEILFSKPYAVGMKYYSYPDYQGSVPYSLLEEEIADYLINEVQNGFSGTKVVNFNNGVPTEEQQSMITSKVMNKLTGSRGQKVIVAFNDNTESKTTVDDIPLNDAPEHYTYLSEECLRKIMLGHNVTSPLLFGVASSNGFSSNADELKNSAILFDNMVIRPFQDTYLDAADKILAFNKISLNLYFKTLQPLEFTEIKPVVDSATAEQETGLKMSSHIDDMDIEEFGEEIDLSEWELIDSRVVNSTEEEARLDAELDALNNPDKSMLSKFWDFVTTGVARPDLPSEQDGKLFMSRYRYSGNTTDKSRAFCKKMTKLNKLYRKEDIDLMSSKASTNPGWGPNGTNTYDIFLYKGGGACHHFWTRETYKRFTDPRKKGAKEITPAEARKAGEILPTPFPKGEKNYKKNSDLVYTKPIDMPNQGFLKKR